MAPESATLDKAETIQYFFQIQKTIQTKMINAGYPDIQQEQSTIKLMLRALYNNPDYQSVAFYWIICSPSFIKELKQRCTAVQNTIAHTKRKAQSTIQEHTSKTTRRNSTRGSPPNVFCKFHASLEKISFHCDEEWRHVDHPRNKRQQPTKTYYTGPLQARAKNITTS